MARHVRAAHPTDAAGAAQKLAVRLGGYVAGVTADRVDDEMRFAMTLRVPAEQLDAALADLKRLAVRIEREQQKTDDVTDQFVDLDARLRTLRATETELQGLLAESRQRQRGAKEIMEIYAQLSEIRTRIEQIQGQLAVLDKLAALSTINLHLAAPEASRSVAGTGWQPLAAVRDSLRTLLGFLRGAGDFAIFALIVLLPAALVVGVPLYLLRRLWRRMRGRRPSGSGGGLAPCLLLAPLLLCGPRILAADVPTGATPIAQQTQLQEAKHLLEERQYAAAASAFQHANDLAGGRCAECLLGLAAAQHRLGEADVSLATTREAIAAAGNSPLAADAYFFLAGLQLQRRPPDLAAAANALTRVLELGDSLRSEALSGLAAIRLAQDDYGAAVTAARQSLAAAPEGPMAKRSRITLCQARQKGYLPGPPVARSTLLSRPWQEAFAAAAAQTAGTTPPLCPGNRGVRLPNHAPRCSEADGDSPYEATGIFSLSRNPNLTKPQKVAAPPPVYTEEARKAKVQGVVILEAIIDGEGCLNAAHVLKGMPKGLDRSALQAVRNWVFEPAELYGIPVSVYYTLTVNFTIQDDAGPHAPPPPGTAPSSP